MRLFAGIGMLAVAVGGLDQHAAGTGRLVAGFQQGVIVPAQVTGDQHRGVPVSKGDAGRAENCARPG